MSRQLRECSLLKMIDSVKTCSEAGERFCFILGAGASVSSGIPSGAQLAAQWLNELKIYELEETKKWVEDEDNEIDENDIGSSYSKLYERRFNTHPTEGYARLQDAMKDAKPGLGYYHLAKILAADKTSMNLVITTNFDSLTEDAIFMYTEKKPQVITHEFLAQYIEFLTHKPVIAKIHRDLMLRPQSSENETCQLDESWKAILKKAFSIYSPIVIGYGGNDGSLMGLLEEVVKDKIMEKPIYWCYIRDKRPQDESRIIKFLNECGGFLVPIPDFDTAMYLFGEKFGHEFSEEPLTKQIQDRIDGYKENRKKIIDNLKKEKEHRELSDEEKTFVDSSSKFLKDEIDELTEKINKNPEDAKLYHLRGKNYHWLSKYEKAVEDFTKAIEIESDNAKYYSNRGASYHWLREYENAVEDCTRAIELEPNNAAYYNERGKNYGWLKEYEKAIVDCTKAIELEPNNAAYYNNRGVNYNWLKEYEKAIADRTKAIELEPNNAEYYNNRGVNYNWLNEYEKAVADFTRAIELEPKSARYYAQQGYALYKIGEADKALSTLEKAIALDKDEALCYSSRGLINLKIAKQSGTECKSSVLEDFNKAIELEKDYHHYRYYTDFAEYYLYVGEIDKAYNNLQKALSVTERYGRAWYYLAKYYNAKGDTQEYERCMAKVAEYRFTPDEDD